MPYIVADQSENEEISTMSPPWTHQGWGYPSTIARPTFSFCGTFSGKDGISAARWLKKVMWELEPYEVNGQIHPKALLRSVDLLLTGEAATWAETFEEVSSLLSMVDPHLETVTRFKNLFQARFPAKSYDSTPTSFDDELHDLTQMKDESIGSYYQRVLAMMHKVGGRDRNSDGPLLTILESTMLEMVIRAFVKGLRDDDVQQEATRNIKFADNSLYTIYRAAAQEEWTVRLWKLKDREENEQRAANTYGHLRNSRRDEDAAPSSTTWHPANTPTSYSHIRAQGQQYPGSELNW